jgi:multiple sugar transport system permease protein
MKVVETLTKSDSVRSSTKANYLAGFLILPAAAVVFVAMIVPLGYALIMSMFDYKMGQESSGTFVFLDNYIRFFHDGVALKALWNTLLFTAMSLGLELVIGIGIAVLLLSLPTRLGNFLRAIYSMPLLISPIIVGLIWRYMYDPTYGLVYYALSLVGLDGVFGGLENPSWALFSVALADVWEITPFIMLVVSAGLSAIPGDLYEAAKIDGANAFRTLFAITLPLLTKVIVVVTVIRGTDAFRVFDIIYALTGGGPANSTLSISIYAFKEGFDNYQMGYAMAMSILMMIILIVLFGPLMRNSVMEKAD